jgi:hypothetical protein
MAYKFLALVAVVLALLLTTGFVNLEGTIRGTTLGGALAVRAGGRTVTLRAHSYRPNRTYLVLTAR